MPNKLRQAIADAYLADENAISAERISLAKLTPAESAATQALALELASRIRAEGNKRGGVDAFTQEYALSTEEGVALMCLAEALLRVPDAETADRLIRDKIAPGDWDSHNQKSDSLFVNASTWALMLTGRIVRMDQTAKWDLDGIAKKLIARSGEPVIRQAITAAMRVLGGQFVLGQTIGEALKASRGYRDKGYRMSFDMLGEAAYTAQDAERHLGAYRKGIAAIAAAYPVDDTPIFERPSISVKLSALHPRYEWVKRERVMAELLPALVDLVRQARAAEIGVTIDAEEADRHEIMLDLFEAAIVAEGVADWNGLGIVVQAYQKRAIPTLNWLIDLARHTKRRIPVRLVKGAYWDTEVKRAQEAGLPDYPVFTRKAATDTSYIACARTILAARDAIFAQFATHNAHTLSAVEVLSGGKGDFEYQRLHGMGESLYELYHEVKKASAVGAGTRIYAPVGSHEDLLAYLVRRLLENGANTSFVNRMADDESPIEALIADPIAQMAKETPRRNPKIPPPSEMFADRKNSSGFLWSDPQVAAPIIASIQDALREPAIALPVVASGKREGKPISLLDPANRKRLVGYATEALPADALTALGHAHRAQKDWNAKGGAARAEILERAADLFEGKRTQLMALAVREAGKTLPNALGEVREAVDFLRYYAVEARRRFSAPTALTGPTGESNELSLHGRGVFGCISPWNFPLSIFAGQVAGALAAGNAVLAKPAEQTPLIAAAAVSLLHEAGVPIEVLQFLPGDGPKLGRALCADARLAGVAFTGSTEAAMAINRALAARSGPIATLIAETGGQNAMIVDSTALPEQVARDAISSAFDSAGQRCSALRVLFVQEDVADKMLDMILGAMDQLKIGDPMDLATDIGPVIDEAAREVLEVHAARMTREAKLLRKLTLGKEHDAGVFFPPHVFEIESITQLQREVFGPVLHVVRYAADKLDIVCDAINATGYGLTLGVHSRIEETAAFVRARVHAGNIYVNRNQIGAVVGVQPFGGEGLSGTGPKAGGPHYLNRFAAERTFTVNTAAAGGNAALLSSS
ncbi:MAG: bifunctional proline dehydrogenase/L-glutamate gamma-semialdehyde dehydrogenase PutA [Alphaproteobacteria bacterium]|nr:bifunctional proline dehydrogenase/L-glutamate gamma-semialdehyde dehydrogenase PutA [Alphaproteobacteria bacterium]MDE1985317.1 bifunctional proline dehydrogenase/L-glutamate gamma-semialdehyde dehydrogenase PutA [Alphaproteobacteria bacterium]MDE2265911.1 bifunctional proline dehydrogenase/L-glutamate gamma-semialdehyde dehydrogenase PutA [Alphaproteobacteria bacterium]